MLCYKEQNKIITIERPLFSEVLCPWILPHLHVIQCWGRRVFFLCRCVKWYMYKWLFKQMWSCQEDKNRMLRGMEDKKSCLLGVRKGIHSHRRHSCMKMWNRINQTTRKCLFKLGYVFTAWSDCKWPLWTSLQLQSATRGLCEEAHSPRSFEISQEAHVF